MELPSSQAVGDAALVESLAHARLAECYQCGKCTAGCPVSGQMDAPPNQLIRLLQLGQVEKALQSQAIWQCVSCQTCSSRCPKKVDCAGVMDALREVAIRRNAAAPGCHRVIAFQQAFLENVRRYGRLNEVEMTVAFKQKTFLRDRNLMLLMQGGGLAPELMKRRKFHLRGEKVRDRGVVGRIFERCTEGAR